MIALWVFGVVLTLGTAGILIRQHHVNPIKRITAEQLREYKILLGVYK